MSAASVLTNLLGTAPADLAAYFDAGVLRVRPDSSIRCLTLDEAAKYSAALLTASPWERLGLVPLDDANDSNPYCYVSHGPCAGAVMHLCHDGDTALCFRSLGGFLQALDSLPAHQSLDDLQPEPDLMFDAAPAVESLLRDDDPDMDILIPVYLPVVRDPSPALRSALTSCNDFFVREAFAEWLVRHGSREDLPLAEALAADPMDQVARPARKALARLRRP